VPGSAHSWEPLPDRTERPAKFRPRSRPGDALPVHCRRSAQGGSIAGNRYALPGALHLPHATPFRLVARDLRPPRRPVIRAREKRSVESQGERGGRVPELALDHPHRDTGAQIQHGPVMPGRVDPEMLREPERRRRLPMPVPDHIRPEPREERRARLQSFPPTAPAIAPMRAPVAVPPTTTPAVHPA
jgi:hypothetical protein